MDISDRLNRVGADLVSLSEKIEIMNDNPSVLISLRVPKALLDQLDARVRERAYKEGHRVTRNGTLVALIQSAVQEQEQEQEQTDDG